MARRTIVLLASILLLAATSGCGDCWWFCYDDDYECWYDDYGNLWCDDGYYAYGVTTQAEGHPFASHEVLSLVNDERTAQGLEPLWLSETVARIATDLAVEMDLQGVLAASPPAGADVSARLQEVAVETPRWAAAYYAGEVPPEDVVAAWMADESTRAALLDPSLESAGAGVHAIDGMTWWTLVLTGP